jgi:hypothetical protein
MPHAPYRHILPPPGFVTAKRAKRELGNISDGMLRSYVTKGEIRKHTPETRTHGFYNLEDVRKIAARIQPYMPNHTVRFLRGTVDDLHECEELMVRIFGTGTTDEQGNRIPANSSERRAAWIEKNPDVFFILKAGSELVGCVFMLPLLPEKIEQVLAYEGSPPFLVEEVQEFTPNVPVSIYILNVGVYASDNTLVTKRFHGSRLVTGLLRVLVDLGQRGIPLQRIIGRSPFPDGIRLMKEVGFAEIESTTSQRNFEIDVPRSGIPAILKYKAALRQWQQQH